MKNTQIPSYSKYYSSTLLYIHSHVSRMPSMIYHCGLGGPLLIDGSAGEVLWLLLWVAVIAAKTALVSRWFVFGFDRLRRNLFAINFRTRSKNCHPHAIASALVF